jgi:hypothetical protein
MPVVPGAFRPSGGQLTLRLGALARDLAAQLSAATSSKDRRCDYFEDTPTVPTADSPCFGRVEDP